jgi:hypothetical protein
LSGLCKEYCDADQYVTQLFGYLMAFKVCGTIEETVSTARDDYESKRKAEQLTKFADRIFRRVLMTIESYEQLIKKEHLAGEEAFEAVRGEFVKETQMREEIAEKALRAMNYGFDFMEDAFGDSQEMVSFVTELNTNYYTIQFLKEYDCDKYYKYNKGLLFEEKHQEILKQLDEVESDLNSAIKY